MDALSQARLSASIASAYITVPGITSILKALPTAPLKVRVLARWDIRDLVSGASDLEVYESVISRGYEFYINAELHGKVSLVDDSTLFMGSANMTAAGLHLGLRGNWECGALLESDIDDRRAVEDLFDQSTKMTDSLYREIKEHVVPLREAHRPNGLVFPSSITGQFGGSVRGLWVRDLFWTSNPNDLSKADANAQHDLSMLGLAVGQSWPAVELRRRFQGARCCRWLIAELQSRGGSLYFGEASALLHSALLEDPKPYRKDVKTLVQNLFEWASNTCPDSFEIETPSYSQRIRFVMDK